jgi:G3E family GTPase
MAVISRSRKQKVNLSLQDILRSESIRHLASTASEASKTIQFEEKENQNFPLSPIQTLYFLNSKLHTGSGRFNQSFTVRLSRRFDSQTIQAAIHSVVQHHSMLRSRFTLSEEGNWQQMISSVSTYPTSLDQV